MLLRHQRPCSAWHGAHASARPVVDLSGSGLKGGLRPVLAATDGREVEPRGKAGLLPFEWVRLTLA
jgi:hypothetical protein